MISFCYKHNSERMQYMEQKKLYRVNEGKKIAGVCTGFAEYFDMDVTIIRLILVVFCLLGGSGVLAYIIAVSESTPGPLMVNLATFVGATKAGILGSAIRSFSLRMTAASPKRSSSLRGRGRWRYTPAKIFAALPTNSANICRISC